MIRIRLEEYEAAVSRKNLIQLEEGSYGEKNEATVRGKKIRLEE